MKNPEKGNEDMRGEMRLLELGKARHDRHPRGVG